MIKLTPARFASAWFVALSCACSGAAPANPAPTPNSTPTAANPPATAPSNTLPSNTPTTGVSTPPTAAATAGSAAPANPPSVTPPSNTPVNPAMNPNPSTPPDTTVLPPAGAKRFADACDERRGSWSVPCSTNADPCNLKSGYPGDEYCLLPPPEGKGIQIHFGPKNYKDAAEVAKYIIKPGEEFNQYAVVNIPTTEDKWFGYIKMSMRPGSHHLINNLIQGKPAEGFIRSGCEGMSLGSFPGTQNLIKEDPPQGIPAPENEGLGRSLPGNASLCQNYHRYNTTEKDHISEIWYNIWFVEEKDIKQKASGVMVNAGPLQPIPAHSMKSLTTTTTVNGDGRIISLFGHRHAATVRFSAWLNEEMIYDSWDWEESRLFNYDSITQNPAINPAMKLDGAKSGVVKVKRGDKVKIQCDVNNTTDVALRFANELYTGEMCILFGSTVGVGIN